jgi:hypothetical protein
LESRIKSLRNRKKARRNIKKIKRRKTYRRVEKIASLSRNNSSPSFRKIRIFI